MLENEVTTRGGTYAACDTDSAFVVATEDGTRPADVDPSIPLLSWPQVHDIQGRFNRLVPFDPIVIPDLLKAERGSLERELWCFAISAKRYVLYWKGPTGPAVVGHGEDSEAVGDDVWDVAKTSQHGLGHLVNRMDLHSSSREWIGEGWRWLVGLDLGADPEEPTWL